MFKSLTGLFIRLCLLVAGAGTNRHPAVPRVEEGVAMKALLGSALVAMALLAGCARDVGEQYVGRWVNTTSEKNVLSIEHNGESFIIRDTTPERLGGGVRTKNHPAILNKGVLQVSGADGTVNYAIDQATGHLSTGDTEYMRVK
ncbi:hypothetical protein GGR74_001360 [Xanthomonas arboricola]|nr:hypothetical protein [Xanthomonas euroxanthea]NIK06658.1 hypothetical protein [Xanthomonas euroxanthea]